MSRRRWIWALAALLALLTLSLATRWGKGRVMDVAYSYDGQLLAVASSVGIFLYPSSTGSRSQGPDDGPEPIRFIETGALVVSLAFSPAAGPEKGLLAGGLADGRVHLWRVADGTLARTLEGHTFTVISVAFGPWRDDLLLASSSADRTMRLWRVNDGQPLATLEGHAHVVEQVAFSPAAGPKNGLLASASMDGTVGLWQVSGCGQETGPCGVLAHTLTGPATTLNSLSFSPDGTLLAAGSAEGMVQLWGIAGCAPADVPDGAQGCGVPLHTLTGPGDGVSGVAFAPRPDGPLLAAGGRDGMVQLWDVSACTTVTPPGKQSQFEGCARPIVAMPGHEGAMNGLAFSPDGVSLVTSGLDQTVREWGIAACAPSLARDQAETCGAPLRTLEGYSAGVNGVAFSSDGRLLAAGLEGDAAGLWQVSDCLADLAAADLVAADPTAGETADCGPPLHTLGDHAGDVDSVAFAPDGSILATGDSKRVALGVWDNTVRLWQVSDGALLQTWLGQRTDMGSCAVYRHSIAFSPGGALYPLAEGEGAQGRQIQDVAPYQEAQDIAFVVSGSHDNLVRL